MASPSDIIPSIAPALNITVDQSGTDRISDRYSSGGDGGCSGFLRYAALLVPCALLVLYLGLQARRNVRKLSHRKSYVMIAYYALLWFAALLNLLWAIVQAWECDPEKKLAWNLLSLFSECGMLTLEISILAFLLQDNYANGLDALAHTFMVSGSFVAVDILIQSIFAFGFGVPLFNDADAKDWGKWSVLFAHTFMLTAVYSFILFVHYSKWKDKLPPRPSFYNYVAVMFVANLMGLVACGLAGISCSFGLWLYNFMIVCRHALYLPFLYVTFLADFFEEEDWLLDNAYYSEMKDAGFFDTEWD